MEAPHQSTYPCYVGRIIWASDANGKVASRLGKYTEEPAEPLPQFLSSYTLSTSTCVGTRARKDKQVMRALPFPMFSQEGNPKILFLSQGGISSISHDKTQVVADKVKEKLSKANYGGDTYGM